MTPTDEIALRKMDADQLRAEVRRLRQAVTRCPDPRHMQPCPGCEMAEASIELSRKCREALPAEKLISSCVEIMRDAKKHTDRWAALVMLVEYGHGIPPKLPAIRGLTTAEQKAILAALVKS